MRLLRELRQQIRALFHSGQLARGIDEEIEQHFELMTADLVADGMSPEEAHAAARRRFGNVGQHREDARDSWGGRAILDALREIRFGMRFLRRNLRTSVMAILVIATGIGVSIAIFTALNGIAFSDVAGPHAGRMVHLGWRGSGDVATRDYRMLQKAAVGLETIAAFAPDEFVFRLSESEGSARRYSGGRVSAEFFAISGESAIRGRTFIAADLTDQPRVVISHRVWQDQFGGEDAAVGSSVLINGRPHTLIGIMPDGFGFPESHDLWIADARLTEVASSAADASRVIALGLLKDGVSIAQVQSQVDAVASELGAEFSPGMRERFDLRVSPLRDAFANDQVENFLKLLMGMGVLVLLAAGANVSNIVIALTANRSLELSVRSSLGATPRHIMGQVLLFGFLLAAAGGSIGIGLAVWGTDLMWKHINASPDMNAPYWWHMNIDGPVVLFVAGTLLLIILGSSLLPAVRAARADNFALLKDSSRTSSGVFIGRLSRILVGAQVCISVALGLCALVVMHDVRRKVAVALPFDAANTLTARLPLNQDATGIAGNRTAAFLDSLQQDMQALPGIEAVGFSSSQAGLLVARRGFAIDDGKLANPEIQPQANVHAFTDTTFSVLGLERLAGRLFTTFDTPESPKVGVVNRIFAERFLGGANPVGRRLRIDGQGEPLTIVGLVSDLLPRGAGYGDALIIVPYAQFPSRTVSVLAAANSEKPNLGALLQATLANVAPDLATEGGYESVREFLYHRQGRLLLLAHILVAFCVIAVVNAALGLYGVIAHSAHARRRELGLRMALGAQTSQILKLVLLQARWQLGCGLTTGLLAGFGLNQAMFSLMGAASFSLLPQFAAVTGVTIVFCLLAAGVPAWRATRINPIEVIRAD